MSPPLPLPPPPPPLPKVGSASSNKKSEIAGKAVKPVPQALIVARMNLGSAIKEFGTSNESLKRLKLWHAAVKLWQDNDELDVAFAQGRLTLRVLSHASFDQDRERGYDYAQEGYTGGELRKSLLGIINNDNYQRSITNNASGWDKGEALKENQNVRLDAGGAGIVRRLNPANIQTRKLTMGLHDLSASLLNPDGYRLKWYTNPVLAVLLPLPYADDVRIYYQLRNIAKNPTSSQEFKNEVANLERAFTRPRLASSLDMGTTYVFHKNSRGERVVRYVKAGEGATSKETGAQCRLNAKENYGQILTSNSATQANEITIAYRQFGNHNKFPAFGIKLKDSRIYKEVKVNLSQTGSYADYEETGYSISGDDFSRTRP